MGDIGGSMMRQWRNQQRWNLAYEDEFRRQTEAGIDRVNAAARAQGKANEPIRAAERQAEIDRSRAIDPR